METITHRTAGQCGTRLTALSYSLWLL